MKRFGLENWFWPLALLIAGILLQFHPFSVFANHLVYSDTGDPRLNNLILEYLRNYDFSSRGISEFFNVPYYYPVTGVGAWTDTLWGTGFIYPFVRAIGLSMTESYNAWILIL